MDKRLLVRKDLCIGCGICTTISSLLVIGDDGLAEPLVTTINDEDFSTAKEASEQCPVNEIEIY